MSKTFPLRIDEMTHTRLKMLAAENHTFVNSIIIEGVELILKKYENDSQETSNDSFQNK